MSRKWKPLTSLRQIVVGEREIMLVHEAGSEIPHKLETDDRKSRRADNKAVKISRKRHRRRKRHGRA